MVCKTGSRSLLKLASLISLVEICLCLTINILLIKQMEEISMINGYPIMDSNETSEFLNFFSSVNMYPAYLIGKPEMESIYGVNAAVEIVWLLATIVLLVISYQENIYNGYHNYLLPWIIAVAAMCLLDVASLCSFMIQSKFVKLMNGAENLSITNLMALIFLPLVFSKAVIFWIVNVFFLVKMVQSFIFLRKTTKRSRDLDDEDDENESNELEPGNYQYLDTLGTDYPSIDNYNNHGYENDEDSPDQPRRTNYYIKPSKPLNGFSYLHGDQIPPRDFNKQNESAFLEHKNTKSYPKDPAVHERSVNANFSFGNQFEKSRGRRQSQDFEFAPEVQRPSEPINNPYQARNYAAKPPPFSESAFPPKDFDPPFQQKNPLYSAHESGFGRRMYPDYPPKPPSYRREPTNNQPQHLKPALKNPQKQRIENTAQQPVQRGISTISDGKYMIPRVQLRRRSNSSERMEFGMY